MLVSANFGFHDVSNELKINMEPKPFDPIEIPSQGRVSKTDIKNRYDPTTSLEDILNMTELRIVRGNGVCDLEGEETNYSIDARRLLHSSVDFCLYELDNHKDQIYSMSISQSKTLDISSIDCMVSFLTSMGQLKYLVELNLSYVPLSKKSLDAICFYFDPNTQGYCPVRRLVLTHCELGINGVNQILTALTENPVIEELLIGGNDASDESISNLVSFLSFNTNVITQLSLGSNKYTSYAMQELSEAILIQTHLKELHVPSNPIGDVGADFIFKALRDRPVFDSLNLNNCNLVHCNWAGNLRVMTCLTSLYLSHNNIDDDGLQLISTGLSKCVCLRYLDLSHNKFYGGLTYGGLSDIIKQNMILTTLILSTNPMMQSTWTMISSSLMENETLLLLDLSHCELTLNSAEVLCRAFEINQICTINMKYNDLPETLLEDPRSYVNEINGVKPLPLLPNATLLSLKKSQQFRLHRTEEIQQSKTVYRIISEQDERVLKEKRKEEGFKDVNNDDQVENISRNTKLSTISLFQDATKPSILSENVLSENPGKSEFSNHLIQSAFGYDTITSSASTTSNTIDDSITANISVGAHRYRALHRFLKKDQVHADAIGGKRLLKVAYGHISTILGVISVTEITTYKEAKELMKPLVANYVGGEIKRKSINTINSLLNVKDNTELTAGQRRRSKMEIILANHPINRRNSHNNDNTHTIEDYDNGIDYGDSAKPLRNYKEEFVILTPAGLPCDDISAKVNIYIEYM